ncbi:hypothetical protein [Streptomyces sp. TLI_185]|uniref:hypothetical protein n=1 Tax=Streptomyces sp. TLI_185 TaxID=2485151 RepID=UPI000F4DD447|nr:hypothetical protein [Streptomyces sp. TLI_185]RPF36341.1 hypothetical protein EDD92_6377 [Streptomyces sp. TLI_185]
MPADEVTHGTDVDESRVRTGPRHAAPRKPLFTRFHMPAGKAIATVAMPTAVLMGMGFTSSLALAASSGTPSPSSKSLTADEYKDCVTALGDDASASPSPSASASSGDTTDKATPSPSSSAGTSKDSSDSGKTSSSDSGSGDKATPTPSPSDSSSKDTSSSDTATPSPSASASSGGGLLGDLGDAITGIFTGGSDSSTSSASPTPTPSASASTSTSTDSSSSDTSASDTLKDTTKKVTDTVNNTVKDTTDKATKTVEEATKAAQKAADSATSASPSPSSSTDAENCPAATDDTGGVDNKVPVADDPWYLNASSLTLKGADYQGIVKVRTANGTIKRVLKYVISGGTDIGDLHQTVKDHDINKTYHVQAGRGTTSKITGGPTTMYTESISGNLLGLIPLTFTPDSPPPLNLPEIYFTNVKVVQAAQFGGTLHVPGMHVYTTDGTG